MAPNMTEITAFVKNRMQENGIEYTIDKRIEVLSELAKELTKSEDLDLFDRIQVPLDIAVEIVRLRTEKQMFGL